MKLTLDINNPEEIEKCDDTRDDPAVESERNGLVDDGAVVAPDIS